MEEAELQPQKGKPLMLLSDQQQKLAVGLLSLSEPAVAASWDHVLLGREKECLREGYFRGRFSEATERHAPG